MLEEVRTFPTSPSDEQIAYTLKHLTYARIDNWIDTDFNTLGWWLQIALLVITLLVWWKLVDKKRLVELTFYGFTIMTVSIWLDEAGYELGLWYYPIDLIPTKCKLFTQLVFPSIGSGAFLMYGLPCAIWGLSVGNLI